MFSRTLRDLEGHELPFYEISSMLGGKTMVKTSAVAVDQTETIRSKRVPETRSELSA